MAVLYLIPASLGEYRDDSFAPQVREQIGMLRAYLVENAKTARAFLKNFELPCPIQEIEIIEIQRDMSVEDAQLALAEFQGIQAVGVLSEAGCPGIADPGAEIVLAAHKLGMKVCPLVGPSSIVLGLMASGLNGQNFSFHGYLPQDASERTQALKRLEKRSAKSGETIIFIETPYRTDKMFEAILSECLPSTLLCVASSITGADESIATKPIEDWVRQPARFGKTPTIFLLNAN